MKLAVQIQLTPDATQTGKLRDIVERFNEAANYVAGVAFEHRTANVFDLRKRCYEEVRERFSLSSQMAQLAIKAARDAYCRDKNIKPAFRKHAAIPYDIRTMSFKGIDKVSLLTLVGRIIVPMIIGKYQTDRMELPKGQSKLVLRKDGKWFMLVIVDVPDASPIPATDFLGVDLGIARVATTSDEAPDPEATPQFSGAATDDVRRKHNLQRKRLQRRRTQGAKKKLKRVAAKEARFRRHENHVISKSIVETAKRTERGIALEDLKGIRERVTARGGEARNRLSGWSFGQLYAFLSYKAQLAGVEVETVDPRNTSKSCSVCGHCTRTNRTSQSQFLCVSCGFHANADVNAARNIRALALSKRAIELVDLTI